MTRTVLKTIARVALAAGILLIAAQAYAKDNICGECHTAKEISSFGNVLGFDKSVYQEKNSLCPGILELKKDTFFAESRMVKYGEFLTAMEPETRRYPEYMKEDLAKQSVKYADLVGGGTPASIAEFTGTNLSIKKTMNELYEKYNKLMDNYKMEKIIGLSLIVVMLLTFLVNLGLKNTLKD